MENRRLLDEKRRSKIKRAHDGSNASARPQAITYCTSDLCRLRNVRELNSRVTILYSSGINTRSRSLLFTGASGNWTPSACTTVVRNSEARATNIIFRCRRFKIGRTHIFNSPSPLETTAENLRFAWFSFQGGDSSRTFFRQSCWWDRLLAIQLLRKCFRRRSMPL